MCTYQLRSPRDAVWLVGVNHQVGFSSCKKRIPTPPVALLHLVRSVQVLQRLLCDMNSPFYSN